MNSKLRLQITHELRIYNWIPHTLDNILTVSISEESNFKCKYWSPEMDSINLDPAICHLSRVFWMLKMDHSCQNQVVRIWKNGEIGLEF